MSKGTCVLMYLRAHMSELANFCLRRRPTVREREEHS